MQISKKFSSLFSVTCCRYTLELPHRGNSNVCLQHPMCYPSLVLLQPRKNRSYITERLLMGRKASNQTKTSNVYLQYMFFSINEFFTISLFLKQILNDNHLLNEMSM